MIDIATMVRSNILEMKPYSSAKDEYNGRDCILLDANENPYGVLNRYPDPYQKLLKVKLATLRNVKTDNIFIGNGSDEVIDLAFRLFCNPGVDKSLTFSPTYGMYAVCAAINNVELLNIPLTEDSQIDVGVLQPHLTDQRIKLLFICSPNNPTGNSIKRKNIEFIINTFKGVVIIDEAYIDFSKEQSFTRLINQFKNLIVCQTLSKAWGLAAARIGVAYANPEIISFYNKIKPPYNVSELNQQEAIKALDNYEAYSEWLDKIISEKERLRLALEKVEVVKKIYPSDANFFLLKVDDAQRVYNELTSRKIITRLRHTQIANCIRVTVGTPNENNELIRALKTMK